MWASVHEFMYSKEDDLSLEGNAHHRVLTSVQILPSFQGLRRASSGGRDDLHSTEGLTSSHGHGCLRTTCQPTRTSHNGFEVDCAAPCKVDAVSIE